MCGWCVWRKPIVLYMYIHSNLILTPSSLPAVPAKKELCIEGSQQWMPTDPFHIPSPRGPCRSNRDRRRYKRTSKARKKKGDCTGTVNTSPRWGRVGGWGRVGVRGSGELVMNTTPKMLHEPHLLVLPVLRMLRSGAFGDNL